MAIKKRASEYSLAMTPASKMVRIVSIDEPSSIAYVKDGRGHRHAVATNVLPGKGAAPEVGETWVIDRTHGAWTFDRVVGYVAPEGTAGPTGPTGPQGPAGPPGTGASLTVEDDFGASIAGVTDVKFAGYQNGWRVAFLSADALGGGLAAVTVVPTLTRIPLGPDAILSPPQQSINADSFYWAEGGCWHGAGFNGSGGLTTDNVTYTFNTGTAQWDLGATFRFTRTNSGTFTIAAGSGVTLRSRLGSGTRTIPLQYGCALAEYIGSNTWVISGDIA